MISLDQFQNNLYNIRKRIEDACVKAARNPDTVRIMAVTKTFPSSYIDIAREGGMTLFGENRVQEARRKYIGASDDIELHLIGHLQRNKAKIAADMFSCIQSIDKYETALALNNYAEKSGGKIAVLIEINTSGENTKFGLRKPDEYWKLIKDIIKLGHLNFRGLMTVGPFTHDRNRISSAFSSLRELFIKTKKRYPDSGVDILSMGMSSDYDIAVEQGSTMVRIGTALFGERSYT